jgi:hypothetical protein
VYLYQCVGDTVYIRYADIIYIKKDIYYLTPSRKDGDRLGVRGMVQVVLLQEGGGPI